jgi:hypothetical protein
MGVRSIVALVGGITVVYVMLRSFSLQSDVTTQAAPNATNTSGFAAATGVLEAAATAGAQLPVVGAVAIIAAILAVGTLLT